MPGSNLPYILIGIIILTLFTNTIRSSSDAYYAGSTMSRIWASIVLVMNIASIVLAAYIGYMINKNK